MTNEQIIAFKDNINRVAKLLDDLEFNYDFYRYKERVKNRTEHIASIVSDIENNNTSKWFEFLWEVIANREDLASDAYCIIDNLFCFRYFDD